MMQINRYLWGLIAKMVKRTLVNGVIKRLKKDDIGIAVNGVPIFYQVFIVDFEKDYTVCRREMFGIGIYFYFYVVENSSGVNNLVYRIL